VNATAVNPISPHGSQQRKSLLVREADVAKFRVQGLPHGNKDNRSDEFDRNNAADSQKVKGHSFKVNVLYCRTKQLAQAAM